MGWLTRKIVDLFNAIARFYYSRKYSAIAERMGRRESEAKGRGFIIVQIDGLAYEHLLEAMERGYAPCMKRLLERGELALARWRCGLPSTTPAAQAGIMYGENFDIPAFRWYEKDSGTSVVCKVPKLARAVQERVSAGRRGILEGGSSYANMMDGDARLSLFTLSALGRQRFFESVRGVGFLLLFLLSPLRVVRVVLLSLWEYLVEMAKRAIALFVPGRRYRRPFDVLSPFLGILINVVLREIQTFGVIIDIYRGMPAIYTNYYSYDEAAHHFGPTSVEAFKALRGIDKQIKQIDRIRTRYRRREYDLYILSDHGMTPSVPFQQLYGCTLGQYIARQVGEGVFTDERRGEEGRETIEAQFLMEELKGLEGRLSKRGGALVRLMRRFIEERVGPEEEMPWDLSRRGDIVVRSSGSMAHIYFNVSPSPLDLSEIAVLYPSLLRQLIEHPGIGLVVGREGGETVIVGKGGTITLDEEGAEIQGENPLASLPEPELAAEQLRRLASFPHSGDLILFGAWHGDGKLVCFEDQVASHGGLGGPQDYPFIMYPRRLNLDLEKVTNAKDLYPHFAAYLDGARRPAR